MRSGSDGEQVCATIIGPELSSSFETILELAALRFHGAASNGDALFGILIIVDMFLVREEVFAGGADFIFGMEMLLGRMSHQFFQRLDNAQFFAMA